MKCPNCSNNLNENNECDLCGYKKNKKHGFLNYRVYLLTVAVIIVGILAIRFMPDFTINDEQGGSGQEVTVLNQELLQSQLAAAYGGLAAYDSNNYFAWSEAGLYRYSQEFTEGELLSNKLINYLLVDDDHLYYCDEYFDFYRVDKEFENTPEKLLTNIYYPVLAQDYLYYQDDSDNESIYKLNLATLEKEKLNDEPSYSLMVLEGSVYYLDENASLKVIDQQNQNTTLVDNDITSFLVSGDQIYYTSTSGLWQYDLTQSQETLLLANQYSESLPFLMINVYQNKLVFVSYQGIVLYDQGGLEVIFAPIDFTKFIVLNEFIITFDNDSNYKLINDNQALEGSMEV